MKLACTLLAAALFTTPVFALAAESNAWLVGTWKMFEDKGSSKVEEDYMDFQADGTVNLRDGKAVYVRCTYVPDAKAVVLTCPVRGKDKLLSMKVSKDRKVLDNQIGGLYRKAT
ncbi:hypothetical protein [Chitinimonas sp.]|uniref:hypothetical protein n=1 Tax=Chitinimonas sp. TaxID=1934313 RepID=UPI002F9257AB